MEFSRKEFSRPMLITSFTGRESSKVAEIRRTSIVSATHRAIDASLNIPLIAVPNSTIFELKMLNAQAGINPFAVFPAPIIFTRLGWTATFNLVSGDTNLVQFFIENTLSNWSGILLTSFNDPIVSITNLGINVETNIPSLISEVFWNGYEQQV